VHTSTFHPKFYGSHKEFSNKDETDTQVPNSITDTESWRGKVGKVRKGTGLPGCLCVCVCVLSIKKLGEKIGRQSGEKKKETGKLSNLKSRKLGKEVGRLK